MFSTVKAVKEFCIKFSFNRELVLFVGDSTVTALEVRRQKEKELRENDLYWQKRLQKQEETAKQTLAILENEYNTTV